MAFQFPDSIRTFRKTLWLVSAPALALSPSAVQAACILTPTPGNDTLVCDSGVHLGPLTDLLGNNTLLFPTGGTGLLDGTVTFGGGTDTLDMGSGRITGAVDQAGGDDVVLMSAGQIDANLQQGAGRDHFTMSGGTLLSLSQGDNIDVFTMSGGRILNFFEDGDIATMTGGRIGRVDMKLDDNLFDMSGGQIDNNLVTGFGNDRIFLSGGSIGGNISVSGGTDLVEISGGSVGGSVLMSTGDDRFLWSGAGTVAGTIQMGPGNDSATLDSLPSASVAGFAAFDGSDGSDTLNLLNLSLSGVSRLSGWEQVNLGPAAQMVLDGNLILGDAGTGTGALSLATGSLLSVSGSRAITSFNGTASATLTNGGTIDLGASGASPGDVLTIAGSYVGSGGRLLLDTELGNDGSASDQLVIEGGTATGTTSLLIRQAGGTGGLTAGDGIPVILATGGATTDPGAFALTGRLAAGPYEYLLFRGGASAASGENWYLRSTLTTPVAPDPSRPDLVPEVAEDQPIFRPEVVTASLLPQAAWVQGLAQLGTFHDRRGDQAALLDPTGTAKSWARLYGSSLTLDYSGGANPQLEGSVGGIQLGHDFWVMPNEGGAVTRIGGFIGLGQIQGDATGSALGWENYPAGNSEVKSTDLALYAVYTRPDLLYVEGVLIGGSLSGTASTTGGQDIDTDGTRYALSIEAGRPFPISGGWQIEPQGQIVWQNVSFDSSSANATAISFDNGSGFAGRLGLRAEGNMTSQTSKLQPFFQADLWSGGSASTTSFGGVPIVTDGADASVNLQAGVVVTQTNLLRVYGQIAYAQEMGGNDSHSLGLSAGLDLRF